MTKIEQIRAAVEKIKTLKSFDDRDPMSVTTDVWAAAHRAFQEATNYETILQMCAVIEAAQARPARANVCRLQAALQELNND